MIVLRIYILIFALLMIAWVAFIVLGSLDAFGAGRLDNALILTTIVLLVYLMIGLVALVVWHILIGIS